jgi:hypothetical protein
MDLIMNMRTVFSPCGQNNTTLVDKMIGNAYEVVRYVAENMEKLLYIVDNMEAIHTAAGGQPILQPMLIVNVNMASYSLVPRADDRYKHVRLTNTTSINFTDATNVLPIGSWYQFKNTANASILLQGTQVTFNIPQSTTLTIRPYGECRVLKVNANEWDVIGDLVTV